MKKALLDIEWDYLRGAGGDVIRRRKPSEGAEPDRQHYNDPLGTIKGQAKPSRPGNPTEDYVISAEGEPLQAQTTDMPSNIRFHGGYLEGKEFNTTSGSDRGHLYRMGVRHYSPALGRFLQRDQFINLGVINESYPLSANPYSYALNQPTALTDTSGKQACPGGCAGGLSEGLWGEIMTHFGAVDTELECDIAWPEKSECWCRTNQGCCVYKGGFNAFTDPCLSGNILPIMCDWWAWRTEKCYEWCCERARAQKKHSPSQKEGLAGNGKGAPKLDPGGRGGDRIWVSQVSASAPADLIMLASSAFTRGSFISNGASNANISGVSHQSFLMVSSTMIIGAIAGGAALISAAGWLAIDQLCPRLKTEECNTSDLVRCLCEVCNSYNRCFRAYTIGFVITGIIAIIFSGGALIPILGALGIVSCFIYLPCTVQAEMNAIDCLLKYGLDYLSSAFQSWDKSF